MPTRQLIVLTLLAGSLSLGCSQPTPQDAAQAREGIPDRAEALPDSVADLIQARVPTAAAGDTAWPYSRQVVVDLDDDGDDETVVLISDVRLDAGGAPLWEDGHRWQVYVQEPDGARTRLYARFLPNGKLTAEIVVLAGNGRPGIVLLEQSPFHIGAYEFRYRGPGQVEVHRRLDRDVDPARRFSGAPLP